MKKKQFVGKAKKVDEDANIDTADTAAIVATPFVSNEAHMMNVDLCFGEIAALRYCMQKVSKEVQQINKVKIPHMLYDQLRWIISRPQPPPDTRVSVRVDTQSYRDQNIRPPSAFKHRVADFVALADTGCQAVCIGPTHLSKLGLSKCDLMEVVMSLSAANGSGLNIVGALFINVSGESSSGKVFQTKQLCYVADGVDKMLLSRGACEKLGIINSKFPAVGAAGNEPIPVNNVSHTPGGTLNDEHFDLEPCSPNNDRTCAYPKKEDCPPPPKFDPSLSASGLRKLLIQHYRSSAFNCCTRQTLPLMKGEPLSQLLSTLQWLSLCTGKTRYTGI